MDFMYLQILPFVYTTSNTFRLSYPVVIRESIIVDNKQLSVSHRMVIIRMLQFAFFFIYVDLK
jgi:hypothetical protein